MKKNIPLAIVIILGFIFVGWTFIPAKWMQDDFYTAFLEFTKTMSPFAVFLGIYSLVSMHYNRIRRKVPKWGYSYVTLTGLVVTATLGFVYGTQAGTPVQWIFRNFMMPISATMFSLLAFYMATAAYKSFRARSIEATVLLVAAIIIMLGQVPLGMAISRSWPINILDISQWIMDVPNLASKRGILLGVGLGSVATSLKILLGIERTYLGGGD
ncbi:hypothetical protein JEZ13_05120 [bacterium]|nr:hypothetical protein [bacterium]